VTEGSPLRSRALARLLPLVYRAVRPVPGVRDYASTFRAYRVSLLKRALREFQEGTITARGKAANAQLLLRVASFSPTIKEVPVTTRYDIRSRPSRLRLRDALVEHWRLGSAAAPAEAR
jgi:dolichol-phosphate mannosyltransferase